MKRQIIKKPETEAPRSILQKVCCNLGKAIAFLMVTILLLAAGLYGVMWILMKGPSPTAQKLFTLSLKETSAVGFIANMYLPDVEIAEIVNGVSKNNDGETTDTSLVTVSGNVQTSEPQNTPAGGNSSLGETPDSDTQGQTDSDDGIKIEDVKGPTFKGLMMIVTDPTRIFVGTPGGYGTGNSGLTLSQMVKNNNAVGGINAGGFYDPGGKGNGGTPDGMVICDGKLAWGDKNTKCRVIGFDVNGILHVGTMTAQEALDTKIRWAVSFGPALIINGTQCIGLASGVNPRTAIGQRADGTVLILEVDGRQVGSLGATLDDLSDVMLEYGAVNAANLDGGSSTLMIYKNKILNVCASVYGPRELATSFLIK